MWKDFVELPEITRVSEYLCSISGGWLVEKLGVIMASKIQCEKGSCGEEQRQVEIHLHTRWSLP